MKKYIFPLIIACVLGIMMSKFMFDQYETDVKLNTVFNNGTKVYFLQYGVYSSIDNMKENMKSFTYYIYSKDNEDYYAYIGLTKDQKNLEKLKGYYKEKGYDIIVKELNLNNNSFITILDQYDSLLNVTEDTKIIEAIISQILSKYEELIK